ncbi:hypothetical protein HCX50_04055 [Microbacterium oxydans]|uniref:SHOCT domain-containing protein n=1 Tax=Microbacterium sp. B19(2022) TaxID=2914045 RepID=UPI0014311DEA|nr:SHOCT domain-containing protein [Microbacterium sp. B19(2022)]NJI58600.1 hypothetical protein [Microbacterium sp. B19(2022)]
MRILESITPIVYEYQGFWGSFGDFIWWFLSLFIFVSYLMVLFGIIGDLFRDTEMRGGMKALWIIFLMLFPIVTAIVYLLARGRGMGERLNAQSKRIQDAQAEYLTSLVGRGAAASTADEISKAKELLDAGAITLAEFEELKVKALH